MTRQPEQTEHRSRHLGGKYLTFFLDREEYGLEILKVHEIIGVIPITPVPRTPDFIRGVVNLRGKVIPVIDMRLKFSMAPIPDSVETCIVVVQAQGREVGVVVDKVSEVLDIKASDIDETPSFGSDVKTDYILGIAKRQGRIQLLLDIEKTLTRRELSQLGRTAEEGAAELEPSPSSASAQPEGVHA